MMTDDPVLDWEAKCKIRDTQLVELRSEIQSRANDLTELGSGVVAYKNRTEALERLLADKNREIQRWKDRANQVVLQSRSENSRLKDEILIRTKNSQEHIYDLEQELKIKERKIDRLLSELREEKQAKIMALDNNPYDDKILPLCHRAWNEGHAAGLCHFVQEVKRNLPANPYYSHIGEAYSKVVQNLGLEEKK